LIIRLIEILTVSGFHCGLDNGRRGEIGLITVYAPLKGYKKSHSFKRCGFLIKRTHKMKKGRLFSLVLLVSVVSISMVGFPLMAQSQVTLNIEDSSGIPGSSGNLVEVSLTNLSDEVKGVSLDVCDVGNYLTCTGCEPTGRTPSGFECIYSY